MVFKEKASTVNVLFRGCSLHMIQVCVLLSILEKQHSNSVYNKWLNIDICPFMCKYIEDYIFSNIFLNETISSQF